MNDKDKQKIVERYSQRLKDHGVNIAALASGNRERQLIRFENFARIGDLRGKSILDIGCGFGDFYQYLLDNGIKTEYFGIDICPPFVEVCRERFKDGQFEVMDFQQAEIGRGFDYVISSQTFNNRLLEEDNEAVVQDVLRKAYAICTSAVAVDMLTAYVDYQEERLYYFSPEKMFTFAKGLTKRVLLKHDYPLFEFMLILYKDFKGWRSDG